jgi:hypothetical protein
MACVLDEDVNVEGKMQQLMKYKRHTANKELPIVAIADAVVQPLAVMIELLTTAIALSAVLCILLYECFAQLAAIIEKIVQLVLV